MEEKAAPPGVQKKHRPRQPGPHCAWQPHRKQPEVLDFGMPLLPRLQGLSSFQAQGCEECRLARDRLRAAAGVDPLMNTFW